MKINSADGLLDAVKSNNYSCPKCGKEENDYDYDINKGYDVAGEHYPKYFSVRKVNTIDGSYLVWTEVHRCTKCKTIYWFRNEN